MPRGIHKLTVLGVAKAAREGADAGRWRRAVSATRLGVDLPLAPPRHGRSPPARPRGTGAWSTCRPPARRRRAAAGRLPKGIDPLDAAAKAKRAAQAHSQRERASTNAWRPTSPPMATAGAVPGHRQAWQNSLRIHVSPTLGKMPVATIDTRGRCCGPWSRSGKDKTVTASRLRGRIERVLSWAGVKGYRDNAIPNPARWARPSRSAAGGDPTKRSSNILPRCPMPSLPAFMGELRNQQGTGARALEFSDPVRGCGPATSSSPK